MAMQGGIAGGNAGVNAEGGAGGSAGGNALRHALRHAPCAPCDAICDASQVLVDAAARHGSLEVQARVAGALWALSVHDDLAERIGSLGGIDRLVHAARSFPGTSAAPTGHSLILPGTPSMAVLAAKMDEKRRAAAERSRSEQGGDGKPEG